MNRKSDICSEIVFLDCYVLTDGQDTIYASRIRNEQTLEIRIRNLTFLKYLSTWAKVFGQPEL